MRAVVFQGVGEPMTVEAVDRPDPGPDGVVVQTEACGVCRSDWHTWRGDWEWLGVQTQKGQILGHEPAGRVVEVGEDVTQFETGDLVTNPFNLSDGTCRHCRAGRSNICESAVPMGLVPFQQGAFAEYYPVPNADHNLVALPEGVDPVAVAGLGCRFATAFHGIVHRVDLTAGDWVAVHGCGGVGLSAIHVADALGGNVVAVDLNEENLEKARDLGADRTVQVPEVDDVAAAVRSETPDGRGVDIAVDALGIAETTRNSLASLDKGGQHLQIGLTTAEEGGTVSIPVDQMVADEVDFYGSYGMPTHEYEEIFQMMAEDKIDPGAVVTDRIALDDVPETIEKLDEFSTVGIPVVTDF
ncbi:zinc-dependent alcohol dehydrogenase family protein [Halanaeroarchaeum sp. HSR-CO]|uniref:zinc-dependent alcohol dehydrogenase family protein n=1 Tax=Halanaeroarchaeum sp. HSR-CO TaxID=2866382 RepID=UPI00217CF75E|nr:zinc-dependent alcohol dehydrogenase family protein [Halanaeroarchaeum sp. HSR-CO]